MRVSLVPLWKKSENRLALPGISGPCASSAGGRAALQSRRAGMDFQNRVGSAPGSGGVLSQSETNAARRERLRRLALETIDLEKDPYFMRNHLGTYECRLCLTIHTNEGNYLAHTQGKKHQANLARRAAKEASESAFRAGGANAQPMGAAQPAQQRFAKIGKPGYRTLRIRTGNASGLFFQLYFPDLAEGAVPAYRFLSAFEQRVEAPNKNYQYLVFAAEPYESIAFRIPSAEVDLDRESAAFVEDWDVVTKQFSLQFLFRE